MDESLAKWQETRPFHKAKLAKGGKNISTILHWGTRAPTPLIRTILCIFFLLQSDPPLCRGTLTLECDMGSNFVLLILSEHISKIPSPLLTSTTCCIPVERSCVVSVDILQFAFWLIVIEKTEEIFIQKNSLMLSCLQKISSNICNISCLTLFEPGY